MKELNMHLNKSLVLSIYFFLVSCGPHPFHSELNEIDRLNTQLDSLETVFNSIDLERAVASNVKVEQDANALKMYVNNYPEAFDKKIGVLIDELGFAKKAFSRIEKNHGNLKEEINYSKKQLQDLKADLNNNNLSAEKGKEYLQKEKKAIDELRKNISLMKQNEKIGVVKYESQLELIEDYKKRQN